MQTLVIAGNSPSKFFPSGVEQFLSQVCRRAAPVKRKASIIYYAFSNNCQTLYEPQVCRRAAPKYRDNYRNGVY